MPDRLELEERLDLPRALRVGRRAHDALDVLRGEPLELGVVPSAPVTSIAFTSMCPASHGASSSRKPVRMLTAPAGTSDVASASRELDRGQRVSLRGDRDDGVPADERREDPRHEPAEGGLRRREHGDDAGRLRHGEVEVRAGDRIRAPEHLRELVRPARVPDDAIDRRVDLLRGRSRRGRGRSRAPPSSPRAGREPGRGCTRSARTSRGTPRAPRGRRRARPCARRGRRSGPPPRTSARTPSAGTRPRCRACTSS